MPMYCLLCGQEHKFEESIGYSQRTSICRSCYRKLELNAEPEDKLKLCDIIEAVGRKIEQERKILINMLNN